MTVAAENVETVKLDMHGAGAQRRQSDQAPSVDPSDEGAHDAPPAVPQPETPAAGTAGKKPRSLPGGIAVAIILSAVVHAGAIVFLGDRLMRQGVEAQPDAVSVEIVLDAPPDTAPKPGAEVEQQAAEPAEAEPEAGESPTADEPADAQDKMETDTAPDTPGMEIPNSSKDDGERKQAEQAKVRDAPQSPPAEMAPPELPSDEPAKTATKPAAPPVQERILSARSPEDSRAAPPESDAGTAKPPQSPPKPEAKDLAPDEAATPEAEPSPPATPEMIVPADAVPIPTPRPEPPPSAVAETKTPQKPAVKHTGEPTPRKQRASKKTKAHTESAGHPARASAPSTRGGATAGEKAAYARRLASHVERYKRYPRAAQRQGVHGTAGLSITINRSGGLVRARLTKSSGAGILDKEARAVAGRAAPYPRPPQGVGNRTITFRVALRFSR